MTDWQQVIDSDFQVRGGDLTQGLIAELSETLRSADPVVRERAGLRGDGPPGAGAGAAARGDDMTARLADPEIQARAFAALILAMIVEQRDYEWLEA